ncbi:MAG: Rrf2 family transcriptional regulator [Phycisphaerae bacterium]
MFSQTVEYALRVIVYLAGRDTTSVLTRQIAAATHVPEGYLAKVLQSLGREGFVKSQRGIHGGFVLARPAHEITIYEVVEAVDRSLRIRTCPLGLPNHGANLCPLHRRLDNAIALVEEALRQSTIADLLHEKTTSKPLDASWDEARAQASTPVTARTKSQRPHDRKSGTTPAGKKRH